VEIVHGSQTSSETIQAIKALLIKVGKMPIVIFKISSRVCCQSDIDKATKTSFGLRMPIVGLVKRFDFAGLDLSQKVLRNPSTRDSRAKQGAAFANRFSWDRRLLEEDKKSFRGHPHDQHESRRSHCEAL
jgi:3-hydroxyacyl-CoA dehydrogenase